MFFPNVRTYYTTMREVQSSLSGTGQWPSGALHSRVYPSTKLRRVSEKQDWRHFSCRTYTPTSDHDLDFIKIIESLIFFCSVPLFCLVVIFSLREAMLTTSVRVQIEGIEKKLEESIRGLLMCLAEGDQRWIGLSQKFLTNKRNHTTPTKGIHK